MADIVKNLKRQDKSLPQGGGVFNDVLNFTGGETDKTVYILPKQKIMPPAVMASVGVVVEATNYPDDLIEAEQASWSIWDGVSQFSPSITAIRVTPSAGAGAFSLTVRTEKA